MIAVPFWMVLKNIQENLSKPMLFSSVLKILWVGYMI